MAKGDHRYKGRRVRGSAVGGYRRPRITVGLSPELIQAVWRRAVENDRSFTAEVRLLVEAGLAATAPRGEHTGFAGVVRRILGE